MSVNAVKSADSAVEDADECGPQLIAKLEVKQKY